MLISKCPNCSHPIAMSTEFCRNCGMKKPAEAAMTGNIIVVGFFALIGCIIFFIPLAIIKYIGNDQLFLDIIFDNVFSIKNWILQIIIWIGIYYSVIYYTNIDKEDIQKRSKIKKIMIGSVVSIFIVSFIYNKIKIENEKYVKDNVKSEFLDEKYLKDRMNKRGSSENNNNINEQNNPKYEEWRKVSLQNRRCIIDNLMKENSEINSIEKLVEKNLNPQSEKVKEILSRC